MTVELIEMTDSPEHWYLVKLDGAIVPCRSGNYEDAKDLYDDIVNDPNYLNNRETVLESATV